MRRIFTTRHDICSPRHNSHTWHCMQRWTEHQTRWRYKTWGRHARTGPLNLGRIHYTAHMPIEHTPGGNTTWIDPGRYLAQCHECNRGPYRAGTDPDPCLGYLPGVSYACCGHGTNNGYVTFTNGIGIYFDQPTITEHRHRISGPGIWDESYTVTLYKD